MKNATSFLAPIVAAIVLVAGTGVLSSLHADAPAVDREHYLFDQLLVTENAARHWQRQAESWERRYYELRRERQRPKEAERTYCQTRRRPFRWLFRWRR